MSHSQLPFDNPYRHGFVRVAVGIPRVRIGDPATNARAILDVARQAHGRGAAVLVLPELFLTGYSCEDLFHQQALLDAAQQGLAEVIAASSKLSCLLVVGLPARTEGRLFNVAAVVHRGKLLGAVPKSYLPNYREFYEKRHFAPARARLSAAIELCGHSAPFGTDLLFDAEDLPGLTVGVEICEDLWSPLPPGSFAALAGATVLCNPSGTPVTIGKASYRRMLVEHQSGQLVVAYLYAGCASGESTTDLAWDGHGMIAEYGEILAESERFALDDADAQPVLLLADVDLDRLRHERERLSSFVDTVSDHRNLLSGWRRVPFRVEPIAEPRELLRTVARFPFVPSAAAERDARCAEAYAIQVHGLVQRLRASGLDKVVLGISGGLDSTHALLVCAQAFERLGMQRRNILCYTMPGFATSAHTLGNAHSLMQALGVSAAEIDIRAAAQQMLAAIEHPAAEGERQFDRTFENVQAGERTSHLFRLANLHDGLVVGTGDLSELALGWCTYGVGDQMAHYNVNASVPKTLIQHLIRWVAEQQRFGADTSKVLRSILDTEISPELVPGDASDNARGPAQSTEAVVGPYALQDFHLYYVSRYGYLPSKVAYLAATAWSDVERGDWPDELPEPERRAFSLEEIKHWLRVFLERFFALSQFKRSAMPNGPKVGSGGSLSPRGDWRAPSDGNADAWLRELDEGVP